MSIPSTTDQEQHACERLRDITERAAQVAGQHWCTSEAQSVGEVMLGNGYAVDVSRIGSSPALDQEEREATGVVTEFIATFDPAQVSVLLDELEQLRSAATAESERWQEFYDNLARTHRTVSTSPWPTWWRNFLKGIKRGP